MHELSLCQAICDTVADHARGRSVARVLVRIGHLRQVVPDTLRWSWDLVVEGTVLDGSEPVVDHVPAVVACRRCEGRTTLDWPILTCGRCGSLDVDLVSGEELSIVAVDVAEGVG